MKNLQKNISNLIDIKFKSNLMIIFNFCLNIIALYAEILSYGNRNVIMYIIFPVSIILSYIYSGIYFMSAGNALENYEDIKPNWRNQHDKLKEFKDKYALGNTYSFQSINLLWNTLIGFSYTWFMIMENNHKWWIILIGIMIDSIYTLFFFVAWIHLQGLKNINKKIDKNLKEFEETTND